MRATIIGTLGVVGYHADRGRGPEDWSYTWDGGRLTAPTFVGLMEQIRALARQKEERNVIDFNWWEVRLDMVLAEPEDRWNTTPADLAENALEALEDAAIAPYLRGAACAVIQGRLDVRCDVVARSAGSAVNIVENTVGLRVRARTVRGGARRAA